MDFRPDPGNTHFLFQNVPIYINYRQYYVQVDSVGSDSGPFPGTNPFWMERGQGRPAEFAENQEWEKGKAIPLYKRAQPPPPAHFFIETLKP